MSTATPKRRAILEALKARLEAITVAGGYRTDAGLTVSLNETPNLGPDDPGQAIVLIVRDDEPGYQGEHVFLRLPISIQALAQASLDEPWLAVEDVLADIKEAIELEDRTLGRLVPNQIERGATTTLPREPGSETVGVEILYVAPYKEVWGHPEA